MPEQQDDLDAVRTLVLTLEPFDPSDRERIIRWAREKLGLPVAPLPQGSAAPSTSVAEPARTATQVPRVTDIKSFVAEKNPTSNNDFAATVAYYYRFEAPEDQRKETINAADLQEACRLTGRERLAKPAQTLVHAYTAGLLEKAGRGTYSISTVGENLVAVTLPLQPSEARSKPRQAKRPAARKAAGKRKGKRSRQATETGTSKSRSTETPKK